MKIPNLHIVWMEGKNLSLPDLSSRSLTTTTQEEHRLRTVEIPESLKFFMTHNLNTQPIQCNYAVSKEYNNSVSANINTEPIHFPSVHKLKTITLKYSSKMIFISQFHTTTFEQKHSHSNTFTKSEINKFIILTFLLRTILSYIIQMLH